MYSLPLPLQPKGSHHFGSNTCMHLIFSKASCIDLMTQKGNVGQVGNLSTLATVAVPINSIVINELFLCRYHLIMN